MASVAAPRAPLLSRIVQIFFARNARAGATCETGSRSFIEAANDTRAELRSPVAQLRGLV